MGLQDLISRYPSEYSAIKNAYNTYLGRDPDEEGLNVRLSTLPGAGGSWTTSLEQQLKDIQGSPEASTYSSSESSPTYSDIDLSGLSDLYPQAYSGLPDWGLNMIKDYVTNNLGSLSTSMNNALSSLDQAPDLIEKTRQSMIDQYKNAMELNQKESLKPLTSNLAARGVINSTTASDAIAKLMNDYQAKYSDQVTNADTWAANALLSNLSTNVSAYQKQMAILNALLESAKTSESSNALATYSLLLPMLLGES
jgi:hypothetical protein